MVEKERFISLLSADSPGYTHIQQTERETLTVSNHEWHLISKHSFSVAQDDYDDCVDK